MEEIKTLSGLLGPYLMPFLAGVGAISLFLWRKRIRTFFQDNGTAIRRRDDNLVERLISQSDRQWGMLESAIREQTEVLKDNGNKIERGFEAVHRRIDLCPHRLKENPS